MSASGRSLWPREHGAYAQLAAPLVAALALRAPGPPAILLAVAACCAFLANEPLLVVLGHRGARMRERAGAVAGRRLAALAIAGGAAAAAGLALAPLDALAIAGVAALPAAGMIALAWTRAEHSLGGELLAAVALPGASAPIAVASGLPWQAAAALWGAWAAGYACSVVAVHRVIARHRRAASAIDLGLAAAVVGITLGSAALARAVSLAAAAVPLAAVSAVLLAVPPRATRLRAIGVALVVASVASAAIAIAVA